MTNATPEMLFSEHLAAHGFYCALFGLFEGRLLGKLRPALGAFEGDTTSLPLGKRALGVFIWRRSPMRQCER